MSYIIKTYDSAIEEGAPDYEDEVESLLDLGEAAKMAENYGCVLTDLNVLQYTQTDPDVSNYDDLGNLQEVLQRQVSVFISEKE